MSCSYGLGGVGGVGRAGVVGISGAVWVTEMSGTPMSLTLRPFRPSSAHVRQQSMWRQPAHRHMLCANGLRGSVFDRWNGDGRWLGLRRRLAVDTGGDGRNGLRPLADSCDVEGDQAEGRTRSCSDD